MNISPPQANLEVPDGTYFGPCSGRDLAIAFSLFGNTVDRFVFCDISYRRNRMSVVEAVPAGWTLISKVAGPDEVQKEKQDNYYGCRPFQPRLAIEIWRRPNQTEVICELRQDRAQDILTSNFTPSSISAFLHISDSRGEGGSDLWFLGSPANQESRADNTQRLLPCLSERLANGAIVITDGSLSDPEFSLSDPFERAGMRWELECTIEQDMRRSRSLKAWKCYAQEAK